MLGRTALFVDLAIELLQVRERVAAAAGADVAPKLIRGSDLCLFDTQAPTLGGARGELIHSARLDNLTSCHAALSALPGISVADTAPRVCFSLVISGFNRLSPPVPYLARAAASFVTGSPPWMMPCFTIRKNVVPSYPPDCAVLMNSAT